MGLSESDLGDLDVSDLSWPKLINHPIKVGDVLSPAAVKGVSLAAVDESTSPGERDTKWRLMYL
jgi:hypothetical protein